MSRFFKRPYNIISPKSAHAEAEFGGGKKGLLMCQNCGAVYYKKHWHHGLESLNKKEETAFSKDTPVKFVSCPACMMIKNNQFEGRVAIKSVPEGVVQELQGLIENFGKRAYGKDSMDRLIGIKKKGDFWEVTLTENQSANKLAKKIKEVFKTVKQAEEFSPEPSDVVYITIEFVKEL